MNGDKVSVRVSKATWEALKAAVKGRQDLRILLLVEALLESGVGTETESRPAVLTKRRTQVARLLFAGMGNREIADKLGIAENTVKGLLLAIYHKLGVADRLGCVIWLSRHPEVLSPDPPDKAVAPVPLKAALAAVAAARSSK